MLGKWVSVPKPPKVSNSACEIEHAWGQNGEGKELFSRDQGSCWDYTQ